ncbi:hypothetical protein SLEP1_g46212 [Rubroshorea leprosula]|uniref:Uncharacterized protein n=1 Tax=Rubroshorea leprosula TaxID=152421 RepID=A0AAV5LNW9_9ROSI|nr:hypothetical protein SLEP1_g46212 [Rubroshorea leprosula]
MLETERKIQRGESIEVKYFGSRVPKIFFGLGVPNFHSPP